MSISKGASRWVICINNIAIKFPSLMSYTYFLYGQIANIEEMENSKFLPREKLCPIIFHLPFGLMTVMKRARILTEEEFSKFDYNAFCNPTFLSSYVEKKNDSFGYINDKIVAVDYA
jgi:hypothetical protein